MPIKRKPYERQHCDLAKLDNYGKCIADCHWNRRNIYKDCAGHVGRTINDAEYGREVPLEKRGKIHK